MRAKIAVDVFSWVAAAIEHPSIPIEGIYRHADALARRYHPVVWFTQEDAAKYPDFALALLKIEIHIQKPIAVLKTHSDVKNGDYNAWMSIALDSPSPLLADLRNLGVYRVAVLHDTMAYEGVFGAGNVATFNFGTRNNDLVLPVSNYAFQKYTALKDEVPVVQDYLPYGCFHRFDALPARREKRAYSVSVSTVYPRKRIAQTADFAMRLGAIRHYHIGRFVRSEDQALYAKRKNEGFFEPKGYLSDEDSDSIVRDAFAYINMSEEEGFSMPPLEALILGVSYLFLSPIAAHKELYADVANFYEPHAMPSPLGFCRKVTDQQRESYFQKYTFANVVRPLEKFLNA